VRHHLLGTGLGVLLVLGLSGAALADERIAFEGLRSIGLEREDRDRLREAVGAALGGQGDLVTPAQAGAADRCGEDSRCVCQVARDRGATVAIVGNVSQLGATTTIDLSLIETATCAVLYQVALRDDGGVTALVPRMPELVRQLMVPRERVSESASKGERDVEATPAIVTVITGDRLRELGITRLADALRLVPGFEATDVSWGDVPLVQGLPATLLVTLDGVPVFNAMNNNRSIGRDFDFALDHCERLEIVRSPGSTLWGQNAYLGIVNIVTTRQAQRRLAAGGFTRYGTQDTFDAGLRADERRDDITYGLYATYKRTRGPRIAVADSLWARLLLPPDALPVWGNGGVTSPLPDEYWDVGVRVRLWDRLELSLTEIHYDMKWEISPFGALLSEDHPGIWDKRHRIVAASWDDRLGGGFSYRVAASRSEFVSMENFVDFPADPLAPPEIPVRVEGLRSLQGNTRPRVTHQAELRLAHELDTGWLVNHALVGATFLHLGIPDSLAELVGIEENPGDINLSFEGRNQYVGAVFVQDELLLGPFMASAGTRLELREPALVLTSQGALGARGDWGSARVVYSEGFRPPEANNLYSNVGTEGNPDLEPERSRALAAELVLRPGGGLSFTAGGTFTRVFDLIVRGPPTDPICCAYRPINGGTIDVLSVYGEARWSLWRRFDLFASYHFKDLDQAEAGGPDVQPSPIPVAQHTAVMGLVGYPVDDLRLFARGTVASGPSLDVRVPQSTAQDPAFERRTLVATMHLTMGVAVTNVWKGLELELKIDNPFGWVNEQPNRYDGLPSDIIEERSGSEVFLTATWER
jgi:outer membrane receptor protein involved in Fe transport